MTYTPSQQSAIQSFEDFLKSDSQVFMLRGAAGTGKTTLLKEFIAILQKKHRGFGLMAPTGRAAHVIGSKTGYAAHTIHKSIYQLTQLKSMVADKEDVDVDVLQARFALKKNEDSRQVVYIVDEASLISDSFSENETFSFGTGMLLTDLFTYADGRKLVIIGDYAQLPPVDMNFSPALDKEYIEHKFGCEVEEVMLREVLRQEKDSAILSNVTLIRKNIEAKSFVEFKLSQGADCIAENDDLLRPYYELSPNAPCVEAAIITYSNSQALSYNNLIRAHYYGDDAPRLIKGDLLMIARNNYAFGAELFNGNIVKVESCESGVTTRTVTVNLGKGQIEKVELRFRKVCIASENQGVKEKFNVTILDNFLDDPSSSIGGLLLRALVIDFNMRLEKCYGINLSEIRRIIRKKDNLTDAESILYKKYLAHMQNDQYYNAVICKYGYAMTCHKAQGGEWENVFVDMFRFGGMANENYFRWAYTALTRASKKIWHYRSPDIDYISKLVVEDIQLSKNIKVSTYSPNLDFCQTRFERLQALCRRNELEIKENRSINYQHIVEISDEKYNYAKYQLFYNSKGYSGKDTLVDCSSEEFAKLTKLIIEKSYVPLSIPIEFPNRPFAKKLVEFIKSIIKELDIQLLDITQEQYQDVFHLKTDGLARVSLCYTGKGNYTYMRLISSLGAEDKKLEEFSKKFK